MNKFLHKLFFSSTLYIINILIFIMRLNICHHNVRHWGIHKNMLSNYYISNDFDIITINSHGLNTNNKEFLKIFGYSNITTGNELHAGTAILIKSKYSHTHYKSNIDNNTSYSIINTDKGKILIFTFYRPPRVNLLPLIEIKRVLQFQIPVIILTDANLHHKDFGHKNNDPLGKQFRNFINKNNLFFLGPNFHTYYSSINKGKPDLIFCNSLFTQFATNINPGTRLPTSDHIPIHIEVNSNPIAIPSEPRYNFNKANWEGFRQELNLIQIPNTNKITTEDLNNITQDLLNNIMKAVDNNIPKTKYKIINSFLPSTKTKKLNIIFNQRHNIYKHNMTPAKAIILNKIRSHIINSYNEDFSKFWLKLTKELELFRKDNPKNFFQRIKNMIGTGENNKGNYLIFNNKEITDPQEQVNTFAQVWENIFKPNTVNDNNQEAVNNINSINNWNLENNDLISPFIQTDFNNLSHHDILQPITSQTVSNFIKKAKSKATSPSGITNIILKELPLKTILHITRIFNAALSAGYFPLAFKHGYQFLIPKPGKVHTNPINYRLITLIEPISKIFEKIINFRLKSYMEETNQFHPYQYGFRTGRSIQDVLLYSTSFIEKFHTKIPNKMTQITCLDIEKAFDKVWLNGLNYKIFQLDLPILLQKFLCNYLSQRTYTIQNKGFNSFKFPSSAGIPQGSSLSPTLFNIFAGDIPLPVFNNSLILSYADDVTILTTSNSVRHLTDKTNRELNSVISWQEKWLVKTNFTKSTSSIIGKRKQSYENMWPIRRNNNYIPYVEKTKILGVTFSSNINHNKNLFNHHLDKKYTTAKNATAKLYRFRHLHPKILIQLFKIFILPIITFSTIPIIHNGKKGLKKVQTLQNKFIRFAHNIAWDEFITNEQLHNDLKIQSTSQTIYTTYNKHYTKLLHRNEEIFHWLLNESMLEDIYFNPPPLTY